jgi:ADP-ribosylglycohydrolase
MACCLAASLRVRGEFDCDDVAARYIAWQEHAFDIGTQTAAALNAIREGTPAERGGFEVWKRSAHRVVAGNGSLMRTAPIAVLLADAQVRRAAALADSAITHFDPRCRLACAAFDAAVARALVPGATPESVRDAALEELAPAAALLLAEGGKVAAVTAAVRALEEDLALAAEDDPLLYRGHVHLHRTQGFVRVAFRLAFWELLHAPTFEAALVDVVNRGGDADTNGAIAGALLGAFYGESAIPERWRDVVLAAVPRQEGPLRDVYHPRSLLSACSR